MLVKPDLHEELILDCLINNYGLDRAHIQFLPLGADLNTAVYRVEAPSGEQYFLKLRSGSFGKNSVIIPKLLHDQGIGQIISPISTREGALWAQLGKYLVILYPFIEGKDGYEIDLTDAQLIEFGEAVKNIHSKTIPRQILEQLPTESFSTKFGEQLQRILQRIRAEKAVDTISADMTVYLLIKEEVIQHLITRTEQLSKILVKRSLPLVVCHSDLHAGNLLIDSSGHLFIVDWDTLLRAPKERDLMYIGGSQGFRGHGLQEEVELFFQGYGETIIDQEALAYYRYARIVEDLTVECDIILSANQNREDRERELEFMKSNFQPGNTIEIALREEEFPSK